MSKGVEVRHGKAGASIRIRFAYRGVECRETLKLEPTRANLAYAERLRGEVLNAIGRGSFRYGDYFPGSKRAAIFGEAGPGRETVGDRLDGFLARCRKAEKLGNLSPSTLHKYELIVKHQLKPKFGSTQLDALSPAVIREWVESLGVTAKTVRNWLSPLRMALSDAVNDGAIESSPLDRVNLSRSIGLTAKRSEWQVEPFSPSEIAAIVREAGPHSALFRFAFATGLRTSELIALEWRDVDLPARLVNVSRAVVVGVVKGTKTRAGVRSVELSAEAVSALKTAGTVGGRVWINPNTGAPYISDKPIRIAWRAILRRARVKYRNPYQTRHTFASTLLSAGANPWKVAQQMGHKDVTMVFRHYGRFIPEAAETAQMPPATARKGGFS